MATRTEQDSLGALELPSEALYGIQTQRAVDNFPISGERLSRDMIRALGWIKWCAAEINVKHNRLTGEQATAIQKAAEQVISGQVDEHFPVDIFQTGSGTSSNMNANEVIAHLAGEGIHPNDHVNASQSSNDTFPTALLLSTVYRLHHQLYPAITHLKEVLTEKIKQVGDVTKTGRTHLMDAMPITLAQEMGTWVSQLDSAIARLKDTEKRLRQLPQGGTAIGTGINAPKNFSEDFCDMLSQKTGLAFEPKSNLFEGIATQDVMVECSGQLKTLAVSLMKIANDLRWMNAGPLAGLGEITLPALQPGSSIMPGKINPVICESMMMIATQVMGFDQAVTIAGQSGNFQLNVMMPLISHNTQTALHLLSQGMIMLADKAIAGLHVNTEHIEKTLAFNPILITALNAHIGYEKGASIAKRAYQEKRPILEVALEETDLSQEFLEAHLNPKQLT